MRLYCHLLGQGAPFHSISQSQSLDNIQFSQNNINNYFQANDLPQALHTDITYWPHLAHTPLNLAKAALMTATALVWVAFTLPQMSSSWRLGGRL